MIELYTAPTSNGQRAAIALEETGLAYKAHKLNLAAGEQRDPAYLKINPAAMIPAIVDSDGPGGAPVTVTQSGAILLYAAEKSGKLLPRDAARRAAAYQWMMHACTDTAGASSSIFLLSNIVPEKSAANVEFFETRLLRFWRAADGQLAKREYLADELSVADLALYPIYAARKALADKAGDLPNLTRWGAMMAARPGVQKGIQACA
jgi:GSH-dependent disulfide-bond oxidoreductase